MTHAVNEANDRYQTEQRLFAPVKNLHRANFYSPTSSTEVAPPIRFRLLEVELVVSSWNPSDILISVLDVASVPVVEEGARKGREGFRDRQL